jgi:hypothetical protein
MFFEFIQLQISHTDILVLEIQITFLPTDFSYQNVFQLLFAKEKKLSAAVAAFWFELINNSKPSFAPNHLFKALHTHMK